MAKQSRRQWRMAVRSAVRERQSRRWAIEATVDGQWHWFAGRIEGTTTWTRHLERAHLMTLSEVLAEQRRIEALGGIAWIREIQQ